MSARDEIATALTDTGLVKITPRYRQSLRARDGFVKWEGRERGSEGLGFVDRWQVWIALPQDVAKAEEWLEDHLAELIAAFDTEVIATSATPIDLVLDKGPAVNGLILEGSRPASD